MPLHDELVAFGLAQPPSEGRLGDAPARAIDVGLLDAEGQIRHRHPVWLLDGDPASAA